jgi:hypothetical protein
MPQTPPASPPPFPPKKVLFRQFSARDTLGFNLPEDRGFDNRQISWINNPRIRPENRHAIVQTPATATAFMKEIRKGNLDGMRGYYYTLKERGYDINTPIPRGGKYEGELPLEYAIECYQNDPKNALLHIIAFLVANGAKKELLSELPAADDTLLSVLNGNPAPTPDRRRDASPKRVSPPRQDPAQALFRAAYDASLNTLNHYFPIILNAATCVQDLELEETLLHKVAEGYTALLDKPESKRQRTREDYCKMAILLIQRGADPEARDAKGQSPRMLCEQYFVDLELTTTEEDDRFLDILEGKNIPLLPERSNSPLRQRPHTETAPSPGQ